jgi:hypothetical protein
MKKAVFAFLLLGFAALAILAGETITLKGTIIDNHCAAMSKDNLAEFVKTHTKACALMPDCAASGYSIFADGKLYKFDQASGKKVEEFLKKDESRLEVVVADMKEIYTCPMHPEVQSDKPGKCPKCGMNLEKKAMPMAHGQAGMETMHGQSCPMMGMMSLKKAEKAGEELKLVSIENQK